MPCRRPWLKLMRADTSAVENLRGWLTTVVARVCLDMLRARTARREEPLRGRAGADRHLARDGGSRARGVGRPRAACRARQARPAERLAFVLHDMFAMSFDEIAPIVGRSTRPRASSRAERVGASRVPSAPEVDLAIQRRVVDAFIAALRAGDMEALVAVLDPTSSRASTAQPARFAAHASGPVARSRSGARPSTCDRFGRRPRRPRARARRQCRARAAVRLRRRDDSRCRGCH